MVAGGRKLRPGSACSLGRPTAQLDFPLEDRQGETFRLTVSGIEDERAPGHDPPAREPGKCIDPATSGRVGSAKPIDNFLTESRGAERLPHLAHEIRNGIPQRHARNRHAPRSGLERILEFPRLHRAVSHDDPANFLEIMVVGRDPEDRHDRAAGGGLQIPRERDRGDGLVQGIERPAEEPGLLPRHDHHRIRTPESIQAPTRSFEKSPPLGLTFQNRRHLRPSRSGVIARGPRLDARCRIPVVDGVKATHPLGCVEEIPVDRGGVEQFFKLR